MDEGGEEGRDWGEEVAEEVWMEIVRRLLPHPLPSPADLLPFPHGPDGEEKIGVTHEEGRALVKDITSLSLVSRRFHRLINDDPLWRDISHFVFGASSPLSRVTSGDWRERMKHRASLEERWRSLDNSKVATNIGENAELFFSVHWSDNLAVAGGYSLGQEIVIVRNPWNAAQRTVEKIRIAEELNWTVSVVFDDEGTIWSSHEGSQICAWDAHTSKQLSRFVAHRGRVRTLKLDCKIQRLFSCSWDSTIKIWNSELPSPGASLTCLSTLGTDLNDERELTADGPHAGLCMDIDLVNHVLASVSQDKSVKIWDWSMEKCVRTCFGHEGWSLSVCVNRSNENLVVSGDDQGVVKLWDTRLGQPLLKNLDIGSLSTRRANNPEQDAEQMLHKVWTVQMDDCKVMTGSTDGLVHVIDLRTFRPRASFEPARQAGTEVPVWNQTEEMYPPKVGVRRLQFSDERLMVASELGLFAIDLDTIAGI